MNLVQRLEAVAKEQDRRVIEQLGRRTYNEGAADLRDLLEAAAKRLRELDPACTSKN